VGSAAIGALDEAAQRQDRSRLIADLALFRDMAAETVEGMPLGFVALDHAMCATYANPMALTLTGASLDALVDRRPWDLFPEIVGTQHQTVRASAPITVEYEVHFAPSDRWAAVLACPTQTGISIFLRDISGQKRAEKTVRSSVALLHGSLDTMLDACMVCSAERDAQGAIVSFRVDFTNVVAGPYLGGPPEKLIGAPIPDWKINPRDMSFVDACRRVVETGDPLSVDALAYAIAGPEGTSTPGALSLQVARFSDGFFATWRDVTETQRLASERERLAAIVEWSADGIVIVDAELRVIYANAAFADDLGGRASEMVGRSVLEVTAGALDATTIAGLGEVARAGQPWLGEADRRLTDGTVARVQIRVTPRLAADGTLEGYVVVSRDVTELREAERAARESEGRYRSIVDGAAEGIYRTSPEGRILAANPALATILGYDSADALVTEVVDVGRQLWADADDRSRILRLLDERGTVHGYECRLVRKDGTPIWVSQHVTVVRDPDGQAAHYDGFVEDITERKRLEAERSLLAAAVEQAADFVIVVGREGIVQAVNPAFERLTGYPPSEVLGRSVASVLRSGVDPPDVYAALDRALGSGEAWSGRLAERRADGGILEVDLSVSPIRDAAGDLIGSVEIGRDRTHEREMEAEREREAQIRVALAETLATIPEDATLERAAQTICDALVTLPFVDVAEVEIFVNDSGVEMLAVAAPPGYPAIAGTRLPAVRAAIMRERCAGGPWAAYVTDDPASGWIPGVHAAGLRALAYGPITHGGQVRGALVLGTFDERVANTLVEQMPGIVSFGATSSALLGERMDARHVQRELRHALEGVLTARVFHPVFQSIVDLETGETMGYEALTRFDSGQRPDLCFAEAWTVGLGVELELATLEAAVAAGKELPAGTWLDLNVSPRLLADPGLLREILWAADRALVLEVTEHELIGDYDALRAAVRELGHDIRLAVDDAGAGVANFGHIIDLRPDFVKLDISLVRRVNANLGRQAMVVGMRHFSRTAGCRLIAEGIETEDEARTLRALGVEFGQGYLFGHPGPAADWTAARAAAPEPSQLELPHAPDDAPRGPG
jgi:PAS domain S-box-containing protein